MNLEGDSTTQGVPGVKGTNSVAGNGIFGDSTLSDAVVGLAHASGKAGVLGLSPNGNAVAGISDNGTGVFGQGTAFGVVGTSTTGEAVHAHSDSGNAVHGDSGQSDAVVGLALASGKAGVLGLSPNGNAVVGISDNEFRGQMNFVVRRDWHLTESLSLGCPFFRPIGLSSEPHKPRTATSPSLLSQSSSPRLTTNFPSDGADVLVLEEITMPSELLSLVAQRLNGHQWGA
jgi:hypothetical protein